MAIELDVKVRLPIRLERLVIEIDQSIRELIDEEAEGVSASGNSDLARVGSRAVIRWGSEASVSVLSTCIGSEEQFGEDGGVWACFSAGTRTSGSVWLVCLAAWQAARVSGGYVVDEVELLCVRRISDPDEFEGDLRRRIGGARGFSAAADRFRFWDVDQPEGS